MTVVTSYQLYTHGTKMVSSIVVFRRLVPFQLLPLFLIFFSPFSYTLCNLNSSYICTQAKMRYQCPTCSYKIISWLLVLSRFRRLYSHTFLYVDVNTYMRVVMGIWTYLYKHIYICTYIYIYIYVYIYIYKYIHIYIYFYTYVYIFIYMDVHINVYIWIYIYIYVNL
jgi:hypothetical protein